MAANDRAAASNEEKDKLLAIAAALEVGSRHPIAHALLTAAYQLHLPATQSLQYYPAGGVEAMIDGALYRIGHVDFALDKANRTNEANNGSHQNNDLTIDLVAERASSAVVLSCQDSHSAAWHALACFYFNDKVLSLIHI